MAGLILVEPYRFNRIKTFLDPSLDQRGISYQLNQSLIAIGSGGMYALSAARMLKKYSSLSVKEIVHEALKTASDICIYTNDKINVEEITK